jgi:hypothetical protein
LHLQLFRLRSELKPKPNLNSAAPNSSKPAIIARDTGNDAMMATEVRAMDVVLTVNNQQPERLDPVNLPAVAGHPAAIDRGLVVETNSPPVRRIDVTQVVAKVVAGLEVPDEADRGRGVGVEISGQIAKIRRAPRVSLSLVNSLFNPYRQQ